MRSPPIQVRRRSDQSRASGESSFSDHRRQAGWSTTHRITTTIQYYGTPGNGLFVGFTPLRPPLLMGRISNRCIGSTRLSSGRRLKPPLTAARKREHRSLLPTPQVPSYEDISSVSSYRQRTVFLSAE